MVFNYSFWRYITNTNELASDLQNASMQGFTKRVWLVFLLGVFLFVFRDSWGMNTESLTPLLSKMTTADYTIARYISLIGAAAWAVVYMAFHLFGMTYVLHLLTSIPFAKIVPLQLLVVGLLLIEKFVVFIVFAIAGQAASVSFLSFGPIAFQFIENGFLLYFLNQLTITTAIIIALQFRFIKTFTNDMNGKKLMAVLFSIHLVLALLTASVTLIPLHKFIGVLFVGGF